VNEDEELALLKIDENGSPEINDERSICRMRRISARD
jgi:hypothetical protein